MKQQYLKLLATVGIIFGSVHVEAQYNSVAQLSAGNDTTLGCNVNCFTLHSSLSDVKATTTYLLDSTLSYSNHFSYNISGATDIASVDEIYSGAIALPFDFCFYGNTYSQLVIGTNGAITFNTTNAYSLNSGNFLSTLPSSEYPSASIMPAYQNLDITAGGSIQYSTSGTAPNRQFIINYYQVPQYGCTSQTSTFQVVLYETTNVIEVYIQDKPICSSENSGNSISGIQKDNTTALALPGKNNANWGGTGVNKAYRFVPNGTSSVSSVKLKNTAGTILATVAATSGTAGQLSADFTNVCPATNTATYIVAATYYHCNGDSAIYSDTINVTKTVTALPVPNTPIYYCQGATGVVPVSATGTSLKWYTTLTGGTGSTTAPTPSSGTVGTFKYYVSQTIGGCESARDSVVVTVGVAGAGFTAFSNSPVCLNDTIFLQATTVPGASFTWTGPSSYLSYMQNPQMNSASYADSGTYTVTVSKPGCADFSTTTHVAITAGPFIGAVGIEHPTQCQGTDGKIKLYGLLNNTTYTTHLVLNGSPIPNGSFTTNGTGMLTITGLTAGFYNSVTVSYAGCGSNEAGPVILNAVMPPTVTSSSTDPAGCGPMANGTITIHGLLAFGDYTINYEKNGVPQTAILLSANSGGNLTIPNLGGGVYTNITATRLGCTTLPEGPIVLAIPPTPVVTPTTNAPICGGDTIFLYGASTISTVTWSWTGPNGYTSTQQNPFRANAITSYSGNYYLTATNTTNYCVSEDSAVEVIVKPVPATPTASSNSPLCTGQTLNLSASGSGVGVTYNWTGPNSFTSTQQYPTISSVTTAAAGNYGVYASKDGCTSVGTATINVVVNQTPSISSVSGTDPTTCSGTNGTLILNGLAASTTYTVSFTKNGTPQTPQSLASNTSGVINVMGLTAGTYTNIIASVSGCSSTAMGPVVLSDPAIPATPTAGNNGPLCSGQILNLTASSSTSGVTYSWTGPNSFSSSQQNPTISNIQTTNAGTYSVVASINGCNSTAATTLVTVNQTPDTPVASSNSPICAGSTLNLTSTLVTGTYSWTGPNSFSSSSQNPSITSATTAATGDYIVSLSANGCTSVSDTVSVVVNAMPAISGTSYTDPTTCNGTDGTITLTGLTAGNTYTVNYSLNGSAQTPLSITANGSGNVIMTGLGDGVYSGINVTISGCTSNTAATITLTDPAAPVITASNNGPICEGDTLALTTTTVAGATYSWSGPGSYTSSIQNPSILNATASNTGTYTIITTLNNCSDTATTSATVYATPATPVITTNSPICSGDTLTLGTSAVTGATYSWWGPNSFTANTQNTSIVNATTAATGTYNLAVTVNGCSSDTATASVTVNQTPNIASTSFNDPTTCSGTDGTITLNGLAASTTFAANYTYNGTAQSQSVTTNGSGIGVITGLSAGVYDSIRVTINSCTSNYVGPITLTDPATPATPTAGSNSPICQGDTLDLTASTITGATYNWWGPNSFTSSTQNPSILNATTAASGTYYVIATVNNCMSDTGTVAVTIHATPATPVITTNSPVCSGDTLTLATSAVTGATYSWWGPNSFTASTQNTSINNVTTAATGTYFLTVSVNGCLSDTGTASAIVNETPAISGTSSTNPTTCGGADGTISLNGLTNNTTYSVYYTYNGTPAGPVSVTSNGSGIATITGLSAGTYSTIYVSLNSCTSNSVGPVTLTDPAAPVITASNNTPICEGDTVTLTATTIAGASYSWSGPGSFSSTQQNPSILSATPSNNGTYTVIATLNNCSDTATTTVTVNATPATPTAGSNSPVCSGNTLNLTASTVSGATYNWWGPNAFTSTQQNPSITSVTTAATGTYYVIATVSGCISDTGSVAVTINPTPEIDSATFTNPTTCAGNDGTITLHGLTASTTYTVNYNQNGSPQSQSVTTNGSGNGTITGLSAGTYSNIIATLTGCSSNTVGPIVLTDPSAPATPTASNNGPLCPGDTLQLTAGTVTGATYNWWGPNSFTSVSQNPVIVNAQAANAGTYYLTVSVNNCTSDTATTTVIINATPATPVAGSNSPVCSGDDINLTANTISGATYNWTGPNSFTSTQQNPTVTSATTANAGDYIVTVSINGCSSAADTVNVIVNETPVIADTAHTDPTNCGGNDGTITLMGLNNNTTYTVNYTLNGTVQSPVTITSNTSGNVIMTGLTAGVYGAISVTLGSCVSDTVGVVTLLNPPPISVTAGNNSPVCEGDSILLTASTLTGATYSWTGPNSFTSTQQNPVITPATTADAGSYIVTATVLGCTSSDTTVVTVNATPATPTAGSNSPVCEGTDINLTATTVSGATYSWTGPNSFTSTQQNPTVTSATTSDAGDYIVSVTANGCVSGNDTVNVIVNPTPIITDTASTNPTTCSGTDGTITLMGLTSGTPYTVNYHFNTVPQSAATITANGSGYVVMTGLGAGTYDSISVSINGCTSNTVGSFVLVDPTAPMPPDATNNSPVCEGDTILLFATTITGATYSWTGPNSFTSSQQNPVIPGATTANAGTYSVTVTVANCTSVADTTEVTVNTIPTAPTAGSNSPVCEGSDINLTATTVSGATYNWTGPNSFTSALQNPTITATTIINAGSYIVSVTANGCTSGSDTVDVIVNETPVITDTASTHPTTCSGTDGTITLMGLTSGTAYTVNYQMNTVAQAPVTITANGSGYVVMTGLGAGTYDSIFVSINGCESNTVGQFILVDPNAPMPPDATNNTPICEGDTVLLFATTVAGATYNWTGPNSFTSNQQNPVISGATTANAGVYSVTITVNNCTSGSDTTLVVIDTIPATPVAGSNSPICSGNDINLTATTISGATYNWTGPNSFTSTQQNPIITSATVLNAGAYIVSVTSSGCTSGSDTVDVIVNETPVILDTAHTDPTICNGTDGTITLMGLTSGTSFTVNYQLNTVAQTPLIITANTSGDVVMTGLGAGTYDSIYVSVNGCNSNIVGSFVLIDPMAPATPDATNNTPICEGDTVLLFANNVTGATYNWSGPNSFTSTQQNPVIANATTTDAGAYILTVTVNGCTSGADTTIVVIDTIPQSPVAGSNSPICTGEDINLTATTIAGVTYSWTGPNSFTSNLQNPTVSSATLLDAGTYIVSVTSNGCASGSDSVDVVVNETPVIADTAHTDPTTCNGTDGTITLIGLDTNITYTVNYQYNGNPVSTTITSDINGNVVITGLSAGTYDTIMVVLNPCSSFPVGPIVLTDPGAPAMPVATNNTPICEGDTIFLFATTIAGVTYDWTGPNGFTSNQQNPVIAGSTTANAGTYSVTVSMNNCTSGAATTLVVVDPTPGTPDGTSNSPLCEGDTLFLSATTISGATYEWTGPNSFTSTQQNPVIPNTTVLDAGMYTVTAHLNACSSGTDTVMVIINPVPATPDASANTPLCEGQTLNLTATTVTGTYDWTGPNSFTSTQQNPSIPGVTLAEAGTYYVSVSDNGCTSGIDSVVVVVDTLPATPDATANSPLCEGDTLYLNATTIAGATYNWTGPNSFTSTLQNPVINGVTLADAGFYVVNTISNSCSSGTDSVEVIVNPATVISGNAYTDPTTCMGTDGTITLNGFTPGNSYTITYSVNGNPVVVTLVADVNGNIIITGLSAGTYTGLQATSISGCSSATVSTITLVDPNAPPTPTASSNSPVCEGSDLTLDATPIVGAVYNWTGPNSFSSNTQSNIITSVTAANAGTYYVSVTVNGCTSGVDSIDVIVYPTASTPVITTNSPVCEGSPINFSVTSTTGATFYWWGPNGFNSTLSNPTIASATLADAGTYYVTATLNGCSSDTASTVVVVDPSPSVTGSSYTDPTTCGGTDGTITLTGLTPGTTYTLNYTLNGVPQTAATLTADAFGNVTLTGLSAGLYGGLGLSINSCNGNIVPDITLTDPNAPAAPTVNNNGPLCEGDDLLLTSSLITGATYAWTGPGGFTSSAQDTGILSVTTANAGTYTLVVTVNGCSSPAATTTVVINPSPAAPVASSNSPICEGGTLNLFASPVVGATYTWTGPNGFNDNNQNPVITGATPIQSGVYYVNTNLGSCGSDSDSVIVVVTPTPAPPTVVTPAVYCQYSTAAPLTANGMNLLWYTQIGGTGSTTAPTPNTSVIDTTVYYVSQTVNGCESPLDSITVMILPNPNPPTVVSPVVYCQGEAAMALTANGTNLLWYTQGVGGSGSSTAPVPNTGVAGTTVYYVSQVVNGCESARDSIVVDVLPGAAAPVVNGPINYCQYGPTLPGVGTYVTGTNLLWYTQQVGGVGSPNAPNPSTASVTSYTYWVSSNVGTCESVRVPVVVTINAQPIYPGTINISYCQNSTAVPLTANGQNLLWYTQLIGGVGSTIAPTPSTAVPGNTVYYVSQTVNGCESDRNAIVVSIKPTPAAPPTIPVYNYCEGETPIQLTAVGQNLLWFTTPTGGVGSATAPTPATSIPGTFYWWVSQTVEGCESPRAMVTVNVFAKPQAPVTANREYCQGDTPTPLTAVGQNLTWYITQTGGTGTTATPTPITTTPGTITYYVSQTVNGCESDRSPLTVTVYQQVTADITKSRFNLCRTDTATVAFVGQVPQTATLNWNFCGATVISGTGAGPYVLSWNTAGTKIISVTITNGACDATATDTLHIIEAPDAHFTLQNDACIGEIVKVQPDYDVMGQKQYNWTFSGAQIVADNDGDEGGYYTLKWNEPGLKIVTLTITGDHCPSKPFRDTIKIHEKPIAKITNQIHYDICSGDSVSLSAYYNTNYAYEWAPERAFDGWNQGADVTAQVEKSSFIYLTVYDDYGCSNQDSIYINTQPCCNIALPTAFTPNGDGKNDVYRLIGNGHISLTTFAIRNRFGQIVFETANQYEAWDGNFQGQKADLGTYYYYVRYKCGDKFVEKKGDVTLIR